MAFTGQAPDWYNDYLREIAESGKALAQEEYAPYEGPRIAEFTPDQQAAFARTRDSLDMWRPYADQAQDALASGQGGLNTMAQMTQRAGTYNDPTYENVFWDNYSPAVQGMQNAIDQIGQRNFQNTTLKGLNDNFAGTGQFGSGRHQILGQDAAANAQSQIEQQKANVMMTGRQNAMGDYLNWAKQEGAMGSQMGNYAGNQARMGTDLMNFGQTAQNYAQQDAGALMNMGTQQQNMNQQNLNLGYQDFMDQQAFPWQQMGRWTGAVQGNPIPTYGSNVQQPNVTNPWLAAGMGGVGGASMVNSAFATPKPA
jgi:hypothetical protein